MAYSKIAPMLLDGGRTDHSKFKIYDTQVHANLTSSKFKILVVFIIVNYILQLFFYKYILLPYLVK
jgi:hypothetical protein